MFERLGKFVSRYWLPVILTWVAVLVLLRCVAPRWDDITRDGDLAYLPSELPSVVGEKLLNEAFPYDRPKSQIAVFIAREDSKLTTDDFSVGYDLARRFKNLHGVAAMATAQRLEAEAAQLREAEKFAEATMAVERAEKNWDKALVALNESIRLDEVLAAYWKKQNTQRPDAEHYVQQPDRFAAPHHNLSLLHTARGRPDEAADERRLALDLDPGLAEHTSQPVPEAAAELPLLDVWTWRDDIFGKKLASTSKQARLILLQLTNEFMAVDNIRVLNQLDELLGEVRQTIDPSQRDRLLVGFSGSAAVGGDLLRAAKDSIKNTELFTIVLVVLILGLVYRSPLLVALPIITIVFSLIAATSIVAMLTQVHLLPGFEWWNFKVFTTTKIFIIVILFGAGTDYFLFLASRYREELQQGYACPEAVSRSLSAVGDALAASALTTILGLGTMFFADFGKFSNSGPAIALCLATTLLACVTLAPALLRALGPAVFWPYGVARGSAAVSADGEAQETLPHAGRFGRVWEFIARLIVRWPGTILATSILIMLPAAMYGVQNGDYVTYDFLSQLPDDRPSKQGAEVMARHFPIGEGTPIVVVAYHPDAQFNSKEGRERVEELAKELYVDGVTAVRNITDPLGDFPPGKQVGLFNRKAWLKRVASPHPRTQEIFVSSQGAYAGRVAKLEMVLEHDPFSVAASDVLDGVEATLRQMGDDPDSSWYGTTFAYSGITAGIRDLKLVTRSDNRRIQVLVVLAVLGVLLVILRRPLICLYMILTVLFSYFVTIGITQWFFAWAGGDQFQGLDWKVPLFLFVILVAIGQDYNVYLATRIFEEQRRLGVLPGLQRAVVRTGGIITSCGVIMAGTFIAMTSGAWHDIAPEWLPFADQIFGASGSALPAIVQLGFALALGVLLDTFVIRPILVPAFIAFVAKLFHQDRPLAGPPQPKMQSSPMRRSLV